ncbi:MAG TPA: KGG domain-containing protein [Candidatus Saccharimonadales bacterium]|nr:KGG domain-containing protein [Candidatus Saccharimonadales bacterium]
MANNNPANNLSDEARSKGGSNSGGNFKNDPQRASEAGKKGAAAQSTEAKARGGQNSHRNR